MPKKKAPKPIVTKKREQTFSERLMEISYEEEMSRKTEVGKNRDRLIRNMIENTKSFLQLSQADGDDIEIYEADGGYYVHYEDIDIAPINPRMVFLVWDCPKCGEKTTSQVATKSWVELGDAIRQAKAGNFEPTEGHECQE